MDFSLNIIDELVASNIHTPEFMEFSNNIDVLIMMADTDLYLEEVSEYGRIMKQKKGTMMSSTHRTVGAAVGAYDDITTVGGTVIGGVWDLIINAISLCAKVLKFLVNKIAIIPKAIGALLVKISKIPTNVKKAIRGDIDLYITANDIENLYNQAILKKLDTFIALGNQVSKTEVWQTFLNYKNTGKILKAINFRNNEMAMCRQMDNIYRDLKMVKFTQTRIDMSQEANIDTYFGNAHSIRFRDLKGVQHECSYFDAIRQLANDINARKAELDDLHEQLGRKFDKTQMNSNYARLGTLSQNRVTNTLQMMSRMIALVGDIVKCVMSDINTIGSSCDKILAKRGITGKKK